MKKEDLKVNGIYKSPEGHKVMITKLDPYAVDYVIELCEGTGTCRTDFFCKEFTSIGKDNE